MKYRIRSQAHTDLGSLGLDFTYTEGDGVHDFSYWNGRIINEIMPFFFGK